MDGPARFFAIWVVVSLILFAIAWSWLEKCPDPTQAKEQPAEHKSGGGDSKAELKKGATFSQAFKHRLDTKPVSSQPDSKFCDTKLAELVAGLGGLLALGLGILQIWYLHENLAAASTNALAAKNSAETLKGSERAYVFVSIRPQRPRADMLLGGQNGIRITLSNRGKTPAILKRLTTATVSSASLIDGIPDNAYIREFARAWVVAADRDFIWPRSVDIPVEDGDPILKGEKTLYCVGHFEYEDVFKEPRETGFCWQYVPDRHLFKPADSSLNYHT